MCHPNFCSHTNFSDYTTLTIVKVQEHNKDRSKSSWYSRRYDHLIIDNAGFCPRWATLGSRTQHSDTPPSTTVGKTRKTEYLCSIKIDILVSRPPTRAGPYDGILHGLFIMMNEEVEVVFLAVNQYSHSPYLKYG